jgi:hypothetical protein
MWWSGIPKTFVEATKAKASEVNENFQAVKEALLYLLSEEENSPFPQLSGGAAKRILTIAQNLTLLNSEGGSQFAQLVEVGEQKIQCGRNQLNSGNYIASAVIAHNLGSTPTVVLTNIAGGEDWKTVRTWASDYTSGNFKLWAYKEVGGIPAGTITNADVAWIAMS